jgi:hypothetical protein
MKKKDIEILINQPLSICLINVKGENNVSNDNTGNL